MEEEEEEVSKLDGLMSRPVLYASWSEGARRLDAEIQKHLETDDEKRLASIVAAIGSYDTTDDDFQERPELFVKGPKCLEKLKELQRCLARDHPQRRRVYLQLGTWNVVAKQIVPLILRYPEEHNIFLTALKIAVLLTVPVDPSSENTSDQVEHLCDFKKEFRNHNVIAAIVGHLEESLEHLESGSVHEDDWRLFQLVLALFQNILAIPERMDWVIPYPIEQYSRLRDSLLESMFHESAPDIILAIATHLSAHQNSLGHDNFLVLQVLHHMFWGQDPEILCKSSTQQETLRAEARRRAEEQERKERLRNLQTRHSRFAGTYVRIEEDGKKTMLATNPFQTRVDLSQKRATNFRQGKMAAQDVAVPLPSSNAVNLLLKDFADQFLETGAYNTLMKSVKDDIERGRTGVDAEDVVTFFQAVQFFTRYEHYKTQTSADCYETVKNIASTMDRAMFDMVLKQWHKTLEIPAKSPSNWRTIVSAGGLLKDMIYILDVILKKRPQSAERDVRMAKTHLYKLFYDQSETGLLNTAYRSIKTFNVQKHPRSHLVNSVGLAHVVIRLIENLIKEGGELRVAKVQRKRKKRKAPKSRVEEDATQAANRPTEEEAAKNNTGEGPVLEERVPDTGESNRPEINTEKPEMDAVKPVECLERVLDTAESNRPEMNTENPPEMDSETPVEGMADSEKHAENEKEEVEDNEVEVADSDDESESEDDEPVIKETTMDLGKSARKFADSTMISKYCWLLKSYDTNGPVLNYYILSMFIRICKDFHLEPLFYQISVLEMFHVILADKSITDMEEHRNLISFVRKIVRNFFKKLNSNRLLYAEVLFSKVASECHEISADYMAHKLNAIRKTQDASTRRRCFADALGEDEMDADLTDEPNADRREEPNAGRSVADALGEDESTEDRPAAAAADVPGNQVGGKQGVAVRTRQAKAKRRRGPFDDEDEGRIKELFEKFKKNRSCSRLIAEDLSFEGRFSAGQVTRKLKQLGLQRVPSASARSSGKKSGNEGEELAWNEEESSSDDGAFGERDPEGFDRDMGEFERSMKEFQNGFAQGVQEPNDINTETMSPRSRPQSPVLVHADTTRPENPILLPTKRKRLVKHVTELEEAAWDTFNEGMELGRKPKRFAITDDEDD